ncbi:homeobox protein ATH1-like isoform X2 [Iris pallida]|uniref:Homeobox protein ATH1-like isoform X2 n=1 Tax=Iris pallida TaxID=29817 RepID=A0AAX6FCK8_IRIPA|nr:homeobox protein ATH1-like isoform X2 [Iris pallida]
MENNTFTTSLPTTDHNDVLFNAISSSIFSSPFMASGTIDHSSYEQIITGNSLLSTAQEEGSLNNIYIPNTVGSFPGEMPMSRTMNQFGSSFSDGNSGDTDMGTSLSAASIVNLMSTGSGSRENLCSTGNSATLALPLNIRSVMSRGNNDSLVSPHLTPRNCGYVTQDGAGCLSLGALRTVHPSYHVGESSLPGWNVNNSTLKMDHQDSYCLPRYELSLSLGSCQSSVSSMPDIPGHCSEKSCSNETIVRHKDSEELSLYSSLPSAVHFPCSMLGSRYLHVVQQILVEISNSALGASDELDYSLCGARMSFPSGCPSNGVSSIMDFDEHTPCRESELQENIDHLLGTEQSKKENPKLLAMLQMIDQRYNQFLDQIQNVVAVFHDVASLGTRKMHARFALHTVSAVYKNLREQITRHMSSQECREKYTEEKQKDFESFFSKEQWALQQLGRKDQQSWRPQRGLPERSVSVLRAWMFQNFLHPYPKDGDKHFLAIQSGLTRNQVSNWFINARVRLWKPMIEEMYSEIKKQQTAEGTQVDFRTHENISNKLI